MSIERDFSVGFKNEKSVATKVLFHGVVQESNSHRGQRLGLRSRDRVSMKRESIVEHKNTLIYRKHVISINDKINWSLSNIRSPYYFAVIEVSLLSRVQCSHFFLQFFERSTGLAFDKLLEQKLFKKYTYKTRVPSHGQLT